MSYNSDLKEWNDSGSEYPDTYSYLEGEQPVDEWDNFLTDNIIKDIKHLIDVTNNDFVTREGGEITSDLTVNSNRLIGNSTNLDFSGTSLTVEGNFDVTDSLDVTNDIDVGGSVDGINLSGFKSNFDSHEGSTSAHGSNGDVAGINDLHDRYTDNEARSAVEAEDLHLNGNNIENAGSVSTEESVTVDGPHNDYEVEYLGVYQSETDLPDGTNPALAYVVDENEFATRGI